MKILVTGATGYLGSDFIKNLKGDIRILTRRDDCSGTFEVVIGDITDLRTVRRAVKGVDLIYHNASMVDHFAPYDKIYNVNVLGTKNILDAAIAEGIEKIVYTSSVAVTDKVKDNYCRTKAEAEELAKKYWGKIEMPIIRPAPIYDSKRLGILKKYRVPMMPLDLTQHIVYKQSVIDALISAGKRGNSKVYTVADKQPVKISRIYETICETRGYKPFYLPRPFLDAGYGLAWLVEKATGVIGRPYPLHEFMRVMLQDRTYDISLAKRELGYNPVDTLEMFEKLLKDS